MNIENEHWYNKSKKYEVITVKGDRYSKRRNVKNVKKRVDEYRWWYKYNANMYVYRAEINIRENVTGKKS